MRRLCFLAITLAAACFPAGARAEAAAGAGTAPVKSSWNVRDHVPLRDFIIQSHRGAGELAPENSRESFELAWSLGTIPEADLRTSKDGVITGPNPPERVDRSTYAHRIGTSAWMAIW